MSNESDFMLGIAAAVADGAAVNWDQAEAQLTTDDDKRVLRSLRLVSEIGTVHDSVGGEADTTRTGQPAGETLPAAGASTDLTAEHWGRYELREQLGAGAQGAVYRAWDPQLECEVALKVLQPRLAASDRVGERMLREGRALAKVRHQNVVNVYAAEVHEGQVGLCMEFIKGRTLEEILKAQGPFGEGEAVTVGLKVGHALSAVHAAGIVHRDVKARNVMREDRGRIVLMDFGTGRDRAQQGAGDLAGTPLYMAPEVLAGSAATQQSDIYSVGVLLYYLVTGQYPVEGRTLDEIIQAHVRGRRKPLAERRPDLPDDFIRVIDRATAPDPDARYETAAILVHDLVSIDVEEAGAALAPRTVTQRVLLGGAWLGIAAIGITLIGFITSMAFNVALERVAVSQDTPKSWFGFGLQSLLAPIFNVVQILFGIVIAVTIWKALRRVVPAFDAYAGRLSGQLRSLARRLGLWNVDSYGLIAFLCALGFFVVVLTDALDAGLRHVDDDLEHDRRPAAGAVSGTARVLLPVPVAAGVGHLGRDARVRPAGTHAQERADPHERSVAHGAAGRYSSWRSSCGRLHGGLSCNRTACGWYSMANGATTWGAKTRWSCSIARTRHFRACSAYPPKEPGARREPG